MDPIVGGPLSGESVALETKAAVHTASSETIAPVAMANESEVFVDLPI